MEGASQVGGSIEAVARKSTITEGVSVMRRYVALNNFLIKAFALELISLLKLLCRSALHLFRMPYPIFFHVMNYLDPVDLLRLSEVNKLLYYCSNDPK